MFVKPRDEYLRDALERGRAEAEISLRTAQFNKALGSNKDDPKKIGLDGDTRMLIHMDKRFFSGEANRKIELSGNGRLRIRTLAELVAKCRRFLTIFTE